MDKGLTPYPRSVLQRLGTFPFWSGTTGRWDNGAEPGKEIIERERDRKARIGLGNGMTGLREYQHPRAPGLTPPGPQQCEAGFLPSQQVDHDRRVPIERIRPFAIETQVNRVPFLLKTLADRPCERVVVLNE